MKVNKVILKAYYNLGEEYILFVDNPLHGKIFENVKIQFKKAMRTICGMSFDFDVIEIEGQEPIECELLSHNLLEGVMIVRLCQDWG